LGNRASKTMTAGGMTTVAKDFSQLGRRAPQTDGNSTLLATFTDDA